MMFGTLGSGAVVVRFVERGKGCTGGGVTAENGVTLGDVAGATCGAVTETKISARCSSAWSWAYPKVAKGAAGDGFWSASRSDWAARSAVLADEVLGMAQLCGKNCTVFAIRSATVLVT
jgi:hypothetical protein